VNNLSNNEESCESLQVLSSGWANPPNLDETALIDSAASITLVKTNTKAGRAKLQELSKILGIPNGGQMKTTETIELLLKKLPPAARKGHRCPGITNNLLAVSELCDAGCSVYFHKHGVEVEYNGEIVLRGWRDPTNRLWRVPLTSEGGTNIIPSTHVEEINPSGSLILSCEINSIYECEDTGEMTRYWHATLAYHPKSTITWAIGKGYLRGCPGLTTKRVNKYIKVEAATEKGHLRQVKQGTRSTKVKKEEVVKEESTIIPPQEPNNEKTHEVFFTAEEGEGLLYSDQTGAFPIKSNRGNKYLAIFYAYDPNSILSVPIKSRAKGELLRAYEKIYAYLTSRGYKPKLHKLDNETSKDVEQFIQEQQAKYQYTPPEMHRTNAAERAIQTWKSAAKSCIAGLPPTFPIANWCKLTPHIDWAVNIVRACRLNPKLSAWEALEGAFHFEHTPVAPPGTPILVHNKPGSRRSWEFNAKEGWYVGPCFNHHKCVEGVMADTMASRISDTVRFQHHNIATPKVTAADRIVKATQNLELAIKQQPKKAPMDEVTAIEKLREVLLGEKPQKKQETTVVSDTHISDATIATERVRVKPSAVSVQEVVSTTPTADMPKIPSITQDDEEDEYEDSVDNEEDDDDSSVILPRYNLRSSNFEVNATEVQQQKWEVDPDIIPDFVIREGGPSRRGLSGANELLQLTAWAWERMRVIDMNMFAGAIIDEETGRSLEYRQLIQIEKYKKVWYKAYANELGRLTKGIRDIPGTDTIRFIRKEDLPAGAKVTYGRIVVDYRPQKDEKNRARLCAGGDKLPNLVGDLSTPTADLSTIKMLWNSVISTPGARYVTMDLKNFYLNTPMEHFQYMKLPIKTIPDEIIEKYNLKEIVNEGQVYCQIRKGMYGLAEAGILAHKLLIKRLEEHGYYPVQFTPGLWRHVWRPVTFTLTVDDFGIKYKGKQHAVHLMKTLEKYYEVSVDWSGSLFCGIKLIWNYDKGYVDTAMPGYIPDALHKFGHPKPTKPQHAPQKYKPIQYGAKVQEAEVDTSEKLTPEKIKHIQEVVGTLLYYGRAVDPTLAATLSTIAGRQANGTEEVEEAVKQLLDYCATHPNTGVRFWASGMILNIHSDASYLSEYYAKSRAAGHHYLGNLNDPVFDNGTILTVSSIIKHVMSSASEAEIAALFQNCKAAIPLRVALEEMGHPQPKTPITTDNSTAHGLIHNRMTPKASKSNDMRHHWLRSRRAQHQFDFLWDSGVRNRADYHSKAHPTKHYVKKRSDYVIDLPTQ